MEKLKDDIIHEVIPQWLQKALQTSEQSFEPIKYFKAKENAFETKWIDTKAELFKLQDKIQNYAGTLCEEESKKFLEYFGYDA